MTSLVAVAWSVLVSLVAGWSPWSLFSSRVLLGLLVRRLSSVLLASWRMPWWLTMLWWLVVPFCAVMLLSVIQRSCGTLLSVVSGPSVVLLWVSLLESSSSRPSFPGGLFFLLRRAVLAPGCSAPAGGCLGVGRLFRGLGFWWVFWCLGLAFCLRACLGWGCSFGWCFGGVLGLGIILGSFWFATPTKQI